MVSAIKEQAKGAVIFMFFILIFGALAIARVETCTGATKCLTNATIDGNLTIIDNLTVMGIVTIANTSPTEKLSVNGSSFFEGDVNITGFLTGGSILQVTGGLNLSNGLFYGDGGEITNITVGPGLRMITPSYVYPLNSDSAGTNYVYYYLAILYHGKDSKSNNGYCRVVFQLPDDYTSGEDITLRTWWRIVEDITGETEVIDYKIVVYRVYDENSISLEQTLDDTWSGLDNGRSNMEEVTIDGTNFNAGDVLYTLFYMEDDNNVIRTQNWGETLIIPTDTSD